MTDVDPRRAGLVEERDHLLRSLEDLDAEHAAGDLDDDDYRALRADYTTRAAQAIRALDDDRQQETAPTSPAPSRSIARTVAWVVGVGVVALVAGVLLARFTGSRGEGDTITGDIRTSAREQIIEAQQLAATGDRAAAIGVLDDVLEREPANAEALTWKGWFTNLSGASAAARLLLDDAMAADPELAEARVFSASLALAAGEPEVAAEHLAVLDAVTATPQIEQLLFQFAVRERTAAALGDPSPLIGLAAAYVQAGEPLEAVGLLAEAVAERPGDRDLRVALAEAYFSAGEALESVKLMEELVEERPDDVELLAARGWIYGRIADDRTLELAIASLDEALSLDPVHPASLVYRAIVRARVGDLDGARADLAAFDTLESQPEQLLALIEAADLRAVLGVEG